MNVDDRAAELDAVAVILERAGETEAAAALRALAAELRNLAP